MRTKKQAFKRDSPVEGPVLFWRYCSFMPGYDHSHAASSTISSDSLSDEKSISTAAMRRASIARNNNFLLVLHFIIISLLDDEYRLTQIAIYINNAFQIGFD